MDLFNAFVNSNSPQSRNDLQPQTEVKMQMDFKSPPDPESLLLDDDFFLQIRQDMNLKVDDAALDFKLPWEDTDMIAEPSANIELPSLEFAYEDAQSCAPVKNCLESGDGKADYDIGLLFPDFGPVNEGMEFFPAEENFKFEIQQNLGYLDDALIGPDSHISETSFDFSNRIPYIETPNLKRKRDDSDKPRHTNAPLDNQTHFEATLASIKAILYPGNSTAVNPTAITSDSCKNKLSGRLNGLYSSVEVGLEALITIANLTSEHTKDQNNSTTGLESENIAGESLAEIVQKSSEAMREKLRMWEVGGKANPCVLVDDDEEEDIVGEIEVDMVVPLRKRLKISDDEEVKRSWGWI